MGYIHTCSCIQCTEKHHYIYKNRITTTYFLYHNGNADTNKIDDPIINKRLGNGSMGMEKCNHNIM